MVITNYRLAIIQNTAATNFSSAVTDIAVGSGSTTPVSSQTTLVTETFRDGIDNTTLLANEVSKDLLLDVTENNSNTINEIGAFDDPAAGNMESRNLTTSFAKTSDKEAYYRLKTTFTAVNS